MTLPTFQEIWTLYLFNAKPGKQPKKDNLLSENIIRKLDQFSSIEISAVDFMEKGKPGGFINGALSSVVRNFFEPNSTLSNQQKKHLARNQAAERQLSSLLWKRYQCD
ncbi:MAG: hypothetical protein Q4A28_09170 [Brachymonas sp.]|nr:hypothetical protein [Brachymonas sp.]